MVVLANATLAKAEAVMSRVYPDYRKFFRYLAVGAVATTVNLSVYAIILYLTSVHYYLLANVVSYHAGMIFSYYLNRTYTFRSAYEKVHYQLASFMLVAYTQFAIVELILMLVSEFVLTGDDLVSAVIANGIAIAVGFVFAFMMNSRLTFRLFK